MPEPVVVVTLRGAVLELPADTVMVTACRTLPVLVFTISALYAPAVRYV